jgi:gliding motility-associated-like protein
MKPLAIAIAIVLRQGIALSQEASFQQHLEGGYALHEAFIGEGQEAFLLFSEGTLSARELYLIDPYYPSLPVQPAKIIQSGHNALFRFIGSKGVLNNGKELIASIWRVGGAQGILYWDIEQGRGWDWLAPPGFGNASVSAFTADSWSNSYIFFGNQGASFPALHLYKLDPEGQAVRQKSFSGFSPNIAQLKPQDAAYDPSVEALALAGHWGDSRSFALRMDTAGALLQGRAYEGILLDKILPDGQGGYFALGSTSLHSGVSGNERDLALLKLDAGLGIVWSKVFFADHFGYHRAGLNLLPDGALALAYSTRGAYPVVLAKLSAAGDILWEKGYPLFEPRIKVFADGSLLLATQFHFDEEGNRFPQVIIAKTDTAGDISGCDTAPACLMSAPIGIESSVFEGDEAAAPAGFSRWGLNARDTAFSSQDFCDIPPPPSPLFELPDTLCRADCVDIEGLPNRYAHGIAWSVQGPGLDTAWQDSLAFRFCFERPGRYEIEQAVWSLGCAYRHRQQVEVLDSLQAWIEADTGYICSPPPAQISVRAGRPLAQAEWSDGMAGIERSVAASGTYAVTVSDGYCRTEAYAELRFIQDAIEIAAALSLPADTTVCEQHLPFALSPSSPYAEAFSLAGEAGEIFWLPRAGAYTVSAEILGCPFEQHFELGTADCRAKLYLPNAFSPNGDGVNDYFAPQGKHFELLELSVFGRWGGLVYQGNGPDARWDGRGASGKALPSGLYVFKLVYLNALLGQQEEAWGEVSLIR